MLRNFINKIRLCFYKDKESYLCFYRILGFYPHRIDLYKQALLHKSSVFRGKKGKLIDNERLEFLGDAILDAIVGDIVYKYFDTKGEGFLTNTRSKIVQRETLNKLAVEIGLDKYIKTTPHLSSHNNYLYGNAFEAVVGAIYLDRGYKCCKLFIQKKIIASYIDLDKLSKREVNFKSRLIEWGQKRKILISFQLLNELKDNSGNSIFQTEVLVENISAGFGQGYSKKESQQIAAKVALDKLNNDKTFIEAVYCRLELRQQETVSLIKNETISIDNDITPSEETAIADEELSETNSHTSAFNN